MAHHFCATCGCGTYSESPDFSKGEPDFTNPRVGVNARLRNGLIVQGGTAWYYISREKILRRYLDETPPWITQMQRAGVTIG